MGLCECGCGSTVGDGLRFCRRHNFRTANPSRVGKKNAPGNRQEYLHQWHMDHRDIRLQQAKGRKRTSKIIVLTHYGNGSCRCVRCGFDNMAALSLDHINDDGYNEPASGHELYARLIKEGFPDGFQTMCMNCQYIKREENGNSSRTRHV